MDEGCRVSVRVSIKVEGFGLEFGFWVRNRVWG